MSDINEGSQIVFNGYTYWVEGISEYKGAFYLELSPVDADEEA